MLLRGATLADGSRADVRLCLAVIDDVAPSLAPQPEEIVVELDGYVLLPSLVEPHAHLDKAFLAERIPNPVGDLIGAINAMDANRHLLTVEDIAERAERAARLMAANGVTLIRTHADANVEHGVRSIEALVAVKQRLSDLVELQVVALAGFPITGAAGAGNRAVLRDAVAGGCDLVGGCPHLDLDPNAATEHFLTVAGEAGLPLDLHTDETLDPGVLTLERLAHRVRRSGFPLGVTASHCVSLGMQPLVVQHRVAEAVADAGISVVALPQTNLFLQGRDHPVAMPRGLTALNALRSAGVAVAAGADNLQDPFNPVGRGDPLETAALMIVAGHLRPAEALHTVTAAARTALGAPAGELCPGMPGDLVAVPGTSAREAIALQPPGRLTFRAGRLLTADASSRLPHGRARS